jgi:integrase
MTRRWGSVCRFRRRDGSTGYKVLGPRPKRAALGRFDTLAEAELFRATAEKLAKGHRDVVTVERWVAHSLDRRELAGLHRSVDKDRSVAKRILRAHFARKALRKLTRPDVVRWVKELLRKPSQPGKGHKTKPTKPLARQSVVNALNLLRRFLADAADEGRIATNPAAGVRVPKVPTESEPWTYLEADEIAALRERLEVETRGPLRRHVWLRREERLAGITIALFAGTRQGEVWGLRWCDVNFARGRLEICKSWRGPTKSGKPRRVPMRPEVVAALKRWRQVCPGLGEAFVFPARGGSCHAKGFDAELAAVLKRAGVRRVKFHTLRHTCASHMVMGTEGFRDGFGNRWELRDAQHWLGHQSITTTERYAHLSPDGVEARARGVTEASDG